MKPRCIVGVSRYHTIAVFDMNGKLLKVGNASKLNALTHGMKILHFYVSDQCDLTGDTLNGQINIVPESIWRKYFSVKFKASEIREKVLRLIPGVSLSISAPECEAILIGLKGMGRRLS